MSENSVKVCHITTVHPRFDTRIFRKECVSLSQAGYEVSLLVADGKGDSTVDGVNIKDIGKSATRLSRMFASVGSALVAALKVKATVYHFHDPELMIAGVILSLMGKKVVYDAHEDVPADIQDKQWINVRYRSLLASLVGKTEKFFSKRYAGVICATPFIARQFEDSGIDVVVVNNYPILGELAEHTGSDENLTNRIAYVGGIGALRGLTTLVEALDKTRSTLDLVGDFKDQSYRDQLMKLNGWKQVQEHGYVDRDGIREILSAASAGIVTFLPCKNHVKAQPTKMFEYMSAAVPVICSDFPLWREIVESSQCGLCVNPEDPAAVAEAITYFCDHPESAAQMGLNGQKAVAERYNWSIESGNFLKFYQSLI